MNQYAGNEQFNCTNGCESASQCEYYNDVSSNPIIPQQQNYVDSSNFYYSNNYDDGVVPANFYGAHNQQNVQSYQNYSNQAAMPSASTYFNQSVVPSGEFPNGNYFIDNAQTYPPCQGPQPWNFAQCYGYYGEAPCQFANVVDMEDFM